MDWAQVLVIILAIALAIFLILAIVLIVLVIKLTTKIKSIASTAERAANNIEGTVSNISRATSPMFVVKLVRSFLKNSRK